MFERASTSVAFADPWSAGLPERRLALLRGSPRIAYYYEQPDPTVFRYRVFNMVEALQHAGGGASATWLTAGEDGIELIDEVDVLVLCRTLYTPRVAALIARARGLGKRVLFDIDDLIFDTRYAHLILETLDQPRDEEGLQLWIGRIARYGMTLRLCDGVITTNVFLADRIEEFVDLPTWVVPATSLPASTTP